MGRERFTRLFSLLVLLFFTVSWTYARTTGYGDNYRRKVAPTKNVIVMIPDGTSLGVLTAARWYKYYNGGEAHLAVDDYLCGTVRSFASNSPIADSAPGGSAFMTGVPPRTKNIAIHPEPDPGNDLIPLDPAMAYRPLATLLEAARIDRNKATGLVVKVEFPHATPAACAAHVSRRDRYDLIASQMAYQDLDVMFGGGVACVTDDIRDRLEGSGTAYYENDIDGFRNHTDGKVWSLWCDYNFPYAIDHGDTIPRLPEMTRKALDILSRSEEGFFLMVEGSLVDWAGHSNDAIGLITEFLDFDDAVRVVMDFAEADGNTTVLIVPDHGNSGFTLGNYRLERYDRTPLRDHYETVSGFRRTSSGMEHVLMRTDTLEYREVFRELTGIELTDGELDRLVKLRGVAAGNYMEVGYGENMIGYIADIMNSRHYFGYVSSGHTGEDVFLSVYHPEGHLPVGVNTNTEINNYLADAMGLECRLPELTEALFAPHNEVFTGMACTIEKPEDGTFPVLWVRNGTDTVKIVANTSYALVDGGQVPLGSVAVYMEETGLFYIPADLKERLFD